jgi:methionyl aminopeptidase
VHKLVHAIAQQKITTDDTAAQGMWVRHRHLLYLQPTTLLGSADDIYNPFPQFHFTGTLRPVYPLSPKRLVPEHIHLPDYAETGACFCCVIGLHSIFTIECRRTCLRNQTVRFTRPHPQCRRTGKNARRLPGTYQREPTLRITVHFYFVLFQLAREVLDIAAAHVRPGITTDEIDEIVHKATIERNAYPSTLNYRKFPKSVCTCVGESANLE